MQNKGIRAQGPEQLLCSAGSRSCTEPCVMSNSCLAVQPPSAMLIATARVLHLVVAKQENKQGLPTMLARALDRAIRGFSDRLVDKMMLCACLGALTAEGEALNPTLCYNIISAFTLKGSYYAVLNTLEQVMQVYSLLKLYQLSMFWLYATDLHHATAYLTYIPTV